MKYIFFPKGELLLSSDSNANFEMTKRRKDVFIRNYRYIFSDYVRACLPKDATYFDNLQFSSTETKIDGKDKVLHSSWLSQVKQSLHTTAMFINFQKNTSHNEISLPKHDTHEEFALKRHRTDVIQKLKTPVSPKTESSTASVYKVVDRKESGSSNSLRNMTVH